ncbi:MAG: hypothetical protein ABH841_02200 [Candidatus Nealsonbacteria bacterium]
MLKPVKFANAVAVVSMVFQLGWTAKMAVIPNLAHYWMVAVMPGYNMASIETNTVSWGMAAIGVLIMGILAWIGTFLIIWLYNRWDKCCDDEK